MNITYDIVLIIQVNSDSKAEHIINTIKSFIYHTISSYKIIISDDSQKNISAEVINTFPAIDVLHTRRRENNMCDSYISLSQAYSYVLQKFDFYLLLKMEAGTLVIDDEPQKIAEKLFNTYPQSGIASHHFFDINYQLLDYAWLKNNTFNINKNRTFMRKHLAKYKLRKLFLKAVNNGYTPAENIFESVYFMKKALLEKLYTSNLLPNYHFSNLNISEQQLFAMLAASAGFKSSDIATADLPFSIPLLSDQFQHYNNKIHSIKGENKLDKHQIELPDLLQKEILKYS